MTLTEQWKKGELPEGEKYIQLRDNRIFTAYFNGKEFREVYNSDIKEILAEVPTFEELRANQKWIKSLEEKIKIYERKDKQATETSIAYNELAKENEELKEIIERHKKATAKAQIKSCDLEIINQRLKELLRECRYKIIEDLDNARLCESSVDIEDFEYLLNRIDNAIGEKL